MSNILYRYPGAKPFDINQAQIFFGREEDKTKLYRLIKLEPLVVLYAKSGMGKSSLLNAGIVPLIEKEGAYTPIIVRFHAWTKGKKETPDAITRRSIAPNGSEDTFLDLLIDDEPSIWHDLKEAQIINNKKILLIFDQFEELFTYPKEEMEVFKTQLAEAIYSKIPERYREQLEKRFEEGETLFSEEQLNTLELPFDLRVVMSIRSDRMSLLNEISDFLPTILKNCYELLPLSIDAARQAIVIPAQKVSEVPFSSPSFEYSNEAINCIIDYLTKNQTKSVESTQLQIICNSVETKVNKEGQIVDVPMLGNLNEVIENYYYRQLAILGDDKAQLAARKLIEEALIFEEEERRLSLYEGQILKNYGISAQGLQQLVDAHLLRTEPSMQGGYVYELNHDTLVIPVLEAKRKRKEEERKQQEKEQQSELERKLKEAQEQTKIEHNKRLRARKIATTAVVACFVAILFFIWALSERDKAKELNEALNKTNQELTTKTNNLIEAQNTIADKIIEKANKQLFYGCLAEETRGDLKSMYAKLQDENRKNTIRSINEELKNKNCPFKIID